MEDNQNRTNWLAWVLGMLTLALLAGGIYFWRGNQSLTRQNDLAEQRADSLLSVKFQLENDIKRLDEQLATTKIDNTKLVKKIDLAARQLDQRDARYQELRRATQRSRLALRDLNDDVARLTTQRDSMGSQMAAMGKKIRWLTDSNTVYDKRTDQLRGQVSSLKQTLTTLVPRALLTGDHFRVEAVKKNNKETAKARKVDRLTVSLNVPAELHLTGQQEVYLSLTNAGKRASPAPLRTVTVNLPTANEVIPVHAINRVDFSAGAQRISFQLGPDVKLEPGTYLASVYTQNRYLGSVEFRFRDSFWFF